MNNFIKRYMISTPGKVIALNIISLIFISFLGRGVLFSQKLNDKIEKYNTRSYNEELYLRTDREIYITGEQVWLKVYKLNGLAGFRWISARLPILNFWIRTILQSRQIKVMIEGNSGSPDSLFPTI